MENSDITLLICGPLHENSVNKDSILYYKSLDIKILYSTWEPQNENDKKMLRELNSMLDESEIIISKYHDIINFDNSQNIYYQAYTWLQAVLNCKTKYVIKSRTNCKYDNLIPIIDKFKMYPEHITCSSIFFRRISANVYSPSDYIVCSSTDETIKAINILIYNCKNKINLSIKDSTTHAESKICFSFLQTRGYNVSLHDNIDKIHDIMKSVYKIVDINSLKFTVSMHGIISNTYFYHDGENSLQNDDNFL